MNEWQHAKKGGCHFLRRKILPSYPPTCWSGNIKLTLLLRIPEGIHEIHNKNIVENIYSTIKKSVLLTTIVGHPSYRARFQILLIYPLKKRSYPSYKATFSMQKMQSYKRGITVVKMF